MAKFDIKTVKPKFVVTTSPDNKIDVVVNKPIIEAKNSKSYFKLKNTGGPRGADGKDGSDGFSPIASVSKSGDTATITITDKEGTTTASVSDGKDGVDGYTPTAWVTRYDDYAQINIQNKYSTSIAKVYDGTDGQDGFSPEATVTQGTGEATISITDKDGTTTATVHDGKDGEDGAPGYSPTASVSKSGDTATITITDENGTTTASVSDGTNGTDGTDGFSPIATVSKSGGTATISITDKDGTTTASVSDGINGQDGAAATIAVDSTSTLPAGSSATVSNVGTSSAARLAFGIPAGANGAPGQDGEAATITVGQVETLQPNQSAYVTNVGTSSAAIFNIGIPKGDKGEAGSGSGDMLAADYDPNGTVASAGGIVDYVAGELPTVNNATLTIQKNGTNVTTFTANSATDTTANITVPPDMTILSYGHSTWNDFINAYNSNSVVYCRASSNNDPGSGSQTRMAFMAYVNNATTPTSVEFQYYRSVSSHSDTQQGDQVFVYTLKNTSGGTWSVITREAYSKIAAGTNMTSSYSSGTLTLSATQPTVNDATLTIQKNGTDVQTFTANSSSNKTANITVPTATSDLTNDSGFITSSSLPTKTSDLTNDGSDGTSTYVEADDLATDLSGKVSKTGDTMTGPLYVDTPTLYDAIRKRRKINGADYGVSLGIGTNKCGRLEFYSGAYDPLTGTGTTTTLSTMEARDDGSLYNGVSGGRLIESADTGTVTTSMVASGAITDAKIDWSSFTTSYTECDKTGAIATPNGNCRVAKIGKIVNLQVNYNYSSANVWNLGNFGDEKIATIPEGYRPQFDIYGAALVKFSSTTVPSEKINTVHLWIKSSGEIRLNNMDTGTITGISGLRGTLTWVIA